ncbi:MAG: hypothetical protein M3530_10405 [Thermoproteota archaeon]|nr:hypothetical protein [Thermoproteota archaeon]
MRFTDMKGVEQELKQELMSETAKLNLERNEMIRKEDSIFLRIDPDEVITLKFDAEMIEVKETTFNGIKKRKFEYTVINKITNTRKLWRVSQRTSAVIDSHLGKGETILKVKRIGDGLDTRYNFSSP